MSNDEDNKTTDSTNVTDEDINILSEAEKDILLSNFMKSKQFSSSSDIPTSMPVLPVRDIVVFNYMIVPLIVGREKSIEALEVALENNRHILICTQKDKEVEEPSPEDIYRTGTIAAVLRVLKLPDNRIKILVQGLSRARIRDIVSVNPFMEAEIEPLQEEENNISSEEEALMRSAREQCDKILSIRGLSTRDIMPLLNSIDSPGHLADLIAANLRLKVEAAQNILECINPTERLRIINKQLIKEVEVASMQAKIQHVAREGMDKAQKDYYLREQLKVIRKELGDTQTEDEDLDELQEALKKAKLSPEAQKEADKQLKRLTSMHSDSSEASIARSFLELMAELPWSILSKDRLDIKKAEKLLNEDHYGLKKVKERILEFLSVRKLNPKSKGTILCFAGPPGVGKTSLGKSIANAMGRKFQRIALGGMRDEAEIRGHRRTYIGAMPGRIINALKVAGTRNPVIMLDEVDKLASDFRGDPASALLEVLDPEQNSSFSDHYLNIPFDLSKVIFICTANHLETIPSALRDRMEVITLSGYTVQEKIAIAKKYILPKQAKEAGLKIKEVLISDTILEHIITQYTREAGLRNLERTIASICRKLAHKKASTKKTFSNINQKILHSLLGAPIFLEEDTDQQELPGLSTGLAWTSVGGEVLQVETTIMKGKGILLLTGQLGDVMKESAQAALSYIRSRAEQLGISPNFQEETDIHIHVPAGAVPKDGPSAGITLVTSIISALSGKPINKDFCMTGEITLRGRILPVGGIKEKILAGVAKKIKNVLIPFQNKKDLEDIPQDLLRKIHVFPVAHIDDALPLLFGENVFPTKQTTSTSEQKQHTHPV
ncbi:MAG: endopeptidase La [Desulfovibrionaceae bacterium]